MNSSTHRTRRRAAGALLALALPFTMAVSCGDGGEADEGEQMQEEDGGEDGGGEED